MERKGHSDLLCHTEKLQGMIIIIIINPENQEIWSEMVENIYRSWVTIVPTVIN